MASPKLFTLSRFLLIPTDRCNLHCRLCSENIPQNKPQPDMTVEEAQKILAAFFGIVDKVRIMHISGGGEVFLHKDLNLLIEACMAYRKQFDRFLMFTNGTILPNEYVLKTMAHYSGVLTVRVSDYAIDSEKRSALCALFERYGIAYKKINYKGEHQDYDGWVDYGDIEPHFRKDAELANIFSNCASNQELKGNWRARNGEVHFCSRSARGTQLGLIPKAKTDYVDLFDPSTTKEQKRQMFGHILNSGFITACDYCNGDFGTKDISKRFPAAEQLPNEEE